MSRPLPPFAPEASCPKCSAEGASVVYHEGATVGAPCWAFIVGDRVFAPHLCRRCSRCGHGWVEATADAGAYADEKEFREDPVPIRKTASAGEVLGTEGMAGVVKTAQQSPDMDPPWLAEDEQDLAQENAAADEG